jgi:hypothetical protein
MKLFNFVCVLLQLELLYLFTMFFTDLLIENQNIDVDSGSFEDWS